MAGALAHLGGLRVLEDAVRLLRQTKLAALAWHAAGAVPFAAGCVLFLVGASAGRPSDLHLAGGALAMAFLLAWMNCCRAVFAGHLRSQLSGRHLRPWTWVAASRLVVGQTVLGATRLIAIPMALCCLLPLGFVVSFYRNATALAVTEDLDLFSLCAKASRLARFRQRRNWVVLALLLLLFPFAFVNVALVLGVLPQAVRILTGYESVFSQSGAYFLRNPVFFWFALASAWMLFDPLVQAAYCVSSLEAESEETGEDLRVALRRVRAAAATTTAALLLAGAGLVFTSTTLRAASAVSPRDLARAVRQTAKAPEYEWSRLPPPRPHVGEPWIVRVARRAWEAGHSAIEAISDGVRRFFRWLFDIRKPANSTREAQPPRGVVPLSVYLLIALTVVAAGFVALRLRQVRAPARASAAATLPAGGTPRADTDDLNPLALPEQEWFALADRYLQDEQWRLAVRALYLASLAWLGRRQFISIHFGKTNCQYECEFRRKAADVPAAQGLFAGNIRVFEAAWYGMHELAAADADGFRAAVEEMMASLEGMT